jgi:stage II sporulation protein AA (anti-sigma F factor antagonist)
VDEPLAELERSADDDDDSVVIRVRGEIDMSNVEMLHSQILEAIGHVGSASLDLSIVSYIDSQGLRLLKRIADRLALGGVELTVIAPPESIAGQLLAITKMGNYLRISSS